MIDAPRLCVICQSPIGKHKSKYCSLTCLKEGVRITAGKYYKEHKEEVLVKESIQHKNNRNRIRQNRHKYLMKLKYEVLTHYSGRGVPSCVKCGEDDLRCLTIDHINGNGAEHRKNLGNNKTGKNFYPTLRTQGYPEGYQTLCMNCQFIKRIEKHETAKLKET